MSLALRRHRRLILLLWAIALLATLGLGFWKGWRYVVLPLPAFLILSWALEKTLAPISPSEVQALADDSWDFLAKKFPFESFVKTWGPLNWDKWVRSIEGNREAAAELKEISGGADWSSTSEIPKKAWDRLVVFIKRHRNLRRRVEVEYKLQIASYLRTAITLKTLKAPAVKPEEWQAIYDRLEPLLESHGKNDPVGDGDFFLVDDQVGEPGHKIELSNPDVLTPRLIADLQGVLKGWQNDWFVVITLHFDEVNPELDPGMLVVWADHVDEIINREQWSRVLGPRFKL